MSSEVRRNRQKAASNEDAVEPLYYRFVEQFYEKENREEAVKLAVRLEAALAAAPEYEGSIRAEEIRSLIAELRGDYAEAARSREAEIRKILELHSLNVNTPGWEYVARQYDFGDVSDRLDILATLYESLGDRERAVDVLMESKQYCEARGIPFDGQDILEELERTQEAET
jgi:hypothetical protein